MTLNIPWVDKYRPLKLKDIIQQEKVITILKNMIKIKNIPHMLLYGPPGTGKTSTIYALALELFGKENINERVLELNASDERGISVVRNKITKFVKSSINISKTSIPPIKLIIMDEADAMTYEAQSALRKLMEITHTTRFCFICNYKNQIIDSIESRCACFRFKLIDKNILVSKLDKIAKKENLLIDETVSPAIVDISEGDVRRAIMILHNLKYIYNDEILTSKNVKQITGYTENINININKINNLSIIQIKNIVTNLINESYPVIHLIDYIKNNILESKEIDDYKKSLILIYLANTEMILIKKGNEYIQLLSLITYIKYILDN